MKSKKYREIVENRFLIYNSLFLNLPFQDIYKTGTLLPIFEQHCEEGFKQEKSPVEIVDTFFSEVVPQAEGRGKFELLFRFIQYVERQIVLFDSIEDATFPKINEVNGKGSVKELINRAASDSKVEELFQCMDEFGLRIVLTAHPTQFYPGHVLAIITDLSRAIRENDLTKIDLILQQLGKTPFINRQKPTPYDEAVSLCWYLENVFYEVVPEIVSKISERASEQDINFQNHGLISIGFWPGGDRDGNPYVNHETSMKVAGRLRNTALKCYYRDIRKVRRRITFKTVDQNLMDIEHKIFNSVYGDSSKGYKGVEQLEDDLKLASGILEREHGGLFGNLLDEFRLKIGIFGFHLATLDIRQDSRKHRQLWRSLSGDESFEFIVDKKSQAGQLREMLDVGLKNEAPEEAGEFLTEMLETFRVIPQIQTLLGERGCNRYIISNSMCPADIIAVFALARKYISKSDLLLDIVPLFESIDVLAASPQIMKMLYELPEYSEHLRKRGNQQTIMLGFSDGTKDGGYLQANYSIFKAKEELTRISREYGIEAIFFDGRGGPPSRGGGNTHAFYSSLGPNIEAREIQLTIQGQTISSNFGNAEACRYNLEQLLTAGLQNKLYPNEKKLLAEKDRDVLEKLATESRKAYLELKAHPAFVPYLERATPLGFFGKVNIGSRPVKRGGDGPLKIEDLRAIPFVGSWAQMKQNVPGYYGLGHVIEQWKSEGAIEEIKYLHKNSLFFRALMENSMQSLTKAFYPASAYLDKHPEFGPFWREIYQEYLRTIEGLKLITGSEELLKGNPVSRQSIQIREKIVLPLITIQQYALQRTLMSEQELNEEELLMLQKLILRCMYGIINAARNAA